MRSKPMVDAKGDWEQLLYTTSRVTVGAAFLHHPIVIILFFVDTFATTIIIRVSHWQESRSRENLEKKWLIFFSLELENCIFISLSLLDFQDFETKILFLFSICEIFKTILFLFSIFKIVKTKFSFYSRFMRFCSLFLFLFLWEMPHILERNMHVWFVVAKSYIVRFLGDIWCQKRTIVNQNLNPFFKSKMSGKISLSPLGKYELSISLLKIEKQHFKFLFLSSKMEKIFSLSLSLLEAWE